MAVMRTQQFIYVCVCVQCFLVMYKVHTVFSSDVQCVQCYLVMYTVCTSFPCDVQSMYSIP